MNNDDPASSASAPLPTRPHPTHRILMAEDELLLRQFNTEALLHSGYHVDAAEDGAAAWENLQLNNYHLLVTDNDMPKLTGVELLHKLHAARMALPVIMATGTIPDLHFTRSPWLKPAALLLKPYTVGELLAAVKQVLHGGPGAPGARGPAAPPPAPRPQVWAEEWRQLLVHLRRNET